MTWTKTKAQIRHAKARAEQRYGIKLTDSVYYAIRDRIIKNKSEPVKRKSYRVTIHRVKYKNIEFKVAYDKERKTIITFLKP